MSDRAHRPPTLARLRLAPLAVLVAAAIVATAAGLAHGGIAGPHPPVAAVAEQPSAHRIQRVCTPTWNPSTRGEPWQGARRAASQRAFAHFMSRENPDYVRGVKPWLFFNDNQAREMSQALGRSTQSAARMTAWASYLHRADVATRAAGGTFKVVVAPAKWDVYHQKLPAWAQPLRGTTRLDALMTAHPELPWIDTRRALRTASAHHLTYEPLDSHWTPYGGWVAWQAITGCLRLDPTLKSVREPALAGVDTVANSNEFATNGVPSGKPARTVPRFAGPRPPVSITNATTGAPVVAYPDGSVDATLLPVRTDTVGALSDKTLVAFRDSTGGALSSLWDWTFARTFSYAHGVDMAASPPDIPAIVEQDHPDVVLYVITERFLLYSPPA